MNFFLFTQELNLIYNHYELNFIKTKVKNFMIMSY